MSRPRINVNDTVAYRGANMKLTFQGVKSVLRARGIVRMLDGKRAYVAWEDHQVLKGWSLDALEYISELRVIETVDFT